MSRRLWPQVYVLVAPIHQLQNKMIKLIPSHHIPSSLKLSLTHVFTSLLECGSQREEIRREESEVSVLHVIPYDRDQPTAWELQVIPGDKKQQSVEPL